MVSGLTMCCLLLTFMDDTTLRNYKSSNYTLLRDVLNCRQYNVMNINWCKTKEVILGFNLAGVVYVLTATATSLDV